MAHVVITVAARADIRRIIDYLEEAAGRPIALRYALAFEGSFNRLIELPESGSPRPEFGARTRLVVINPYLIFYETDESADSVRVLRVLHGRRKITVEMLRS
jgi:toxin ParE1/3/4